MWIKSGILAICIACLLIRAFGIYKLPPLVPITVLSAHIGQILCLMHDRLLAEWERKHDLH